MSTYNPSTRKTEEEHWKFNGSLVYIENFRSTRVRVRPHLGKKKGFPFLPSLQGFAPTCLNSNHYTDHPRKAAAFISLTYLLFSILTSFFFLFLNFIFILFFFFVCVYISYVCRCLNRPERTVRCPGTRFISVCELTDMGSGNWTGSSRRAVHQLLKHLSSPWFQFSMYTSLPLYISDFYISMNFSIYHQKLECTVHRS